MTVDKYKIVLAYRQLYRSGLHAVRYSTPERYTLKRSLDEAFRNGTHADFDAQRIGNTILFLQHAAKEKGMEHRILKNLLIVRWWEAQDPSRRKKYGKPS